MQARSALVCACCSLFLLTRAGSEKRIPPGPRIRVLSQQTRSTLTEQWWQGNKLFQAGQYQKAARIFEKGCSEAKQAGDLYMAVRFLNSLGSCQYAIFQYREAMKAYLEANRMAEKTGDWKMAAAISSNISSVYAQMGDLEAARQSAERALLALRGRNQPEYFPRLLVRVASLRARQGDFDGAVPLFERGIEEAARHGDLTALAQAWNQLGYEYLDRSELRLAEHALLEAFRLRRMFRSPDLHLSYRNLGMLRMEQGDYRSASRLLDEAIAAAKRSAGLVPLWTIYSHRGRLRLKESRAEAALADFRTALDLAKRWRLEVLPADSMRVSMDVGLDQLYSALLETAATLYFKTGREALAREAFEAAEENRAASLRALIAQGENGRAALPGEFGAKLAELHAAEVSLLRRDDPAVKERIRQLRHDLKEMEIRAGLAYDSKADFGWGAQESKLLEQAREALGSSDAFLSFHLGGKESYLWALVREGYRLHRLPPRARLAARIARFVEAIRGDSQETTALGSALYGELFGELEPATRRKPHWLLALDGALFDLPLPALVADHEDGRPVYLIERHSLQLVPSAHMLGSRPAMHWTGPFVGVGDAVHNQADPRWPGRHTGSWGGLRRLLPWAKSGGETATALEMPRLPGSGREIAACANAWKGPVPPVLLTGGDACGAALRKALERRPSVLHLATHVIAPEQAPGQGLIALSLQSGGEPELVGPATIWNWGLKSDLVVLSGCSSGQGAVLPGAGLMGLSRAWLASGSGAVVASRWPAPDDTGEFFLSFYRHLRETGAARRPDTALQRAQLEMLRSGTWRSSPKYWAAYFVAGRG